MLFIASIYLLVFSETCEIAPNAGSSSGFSSSSIVDVRERAYFNSQKVPGFVFVLLLKFLIL